MELTILVVGGIALVGGMALGAGLYFAYIRTLGEKQMDAAEKEAERIRNKAKSEATRIEREAGNRAKDFETRARRNLENELKKDQQKVGRLEEQLKDKEKRLDQDYKRKEDQLQSRLQQLDEKDNQLKTNEKRYQDLVRETERQISDLKHKLETVANMTTDQARDELKRALENEAKMSAAEQIAQIEKQSEAEVRKKMRMMLAQAIARYAGEVAAEKTVSTIQISGEEMKGKIIGREGRNIRALEAACGVDIIIDETPDSVIISSFDPVRREVGRRSLLKLMEDGRVHPARIEEVVDKTKNELISSFKEDGEKACVELGITGVRPQLLDVVGALKYRHSDMQNALQQAIEVGHLAGLMALEIGYDPKLARRAGLLHEIGRALDHTVEGSIAKAGAEFARRHGERDDICHAIAARDDNSGDEPKSVLAHLVLAAKNICESRPGARRQNMESFIRRLEDLESIGNSFDGVERTFALQSGKEVRVIVDSSRVTDEQAVMLSRDIARKIEREMNFQGQVKVAVVRETRIVEHAR